MAKKQPVVLRKLEWRARVVMAERGIRSVSALRRELETIGITISLQQLGRLIDGKSPRWNQEIVEGMMTVMQCELSDLVR